MRGKLLAAALVLGGCAGAPGAWLVRKTPTGGVVEVEGPYMERTAKAMIVMAVHCDGPFEVLDGEGRRVDSPSTEQRRQPFVCTERTERAAATNRSR